MTNFANIGKYNTDNIDDNTPILRKNMSNIYLRTFSFANRGISPRRIAFLTKTLCMFS